MHLILLSLMSTRLLLLKSNIFMHPNQLFEKEVNTLDYIVMDFKFGNTILSNCDNLLDFSVKNYKDGRFIFNSDI